MDRNEGSSIGASMGELEEQALKMGAMAKMCNGDNMQSPLEWGKTTTEA